MPPATDVAVVKQLQRQRVLRCGEACSIPVLVPQRDGLPFAMSVEIAPPALQQSATRAAAELRAAAAAHERRNNEIVEGGIYELLYFLEGRGRVSVEGQRGWVAVAAGDSVMAAAGRISVVCRCDGQGDADAAAAGPHLGSGSDCGRNGLGNGAGVDPVLHGPRLVFIRMLIPYDFMMAAGDEARAAACCDAASAVTQHWQLQDAEPLSPAYLRLLLAATERQTREFALRDVGASPLQPAASQDASGEGTASVHSRGDDGTAAAATGRDADATSSAWSEADRAAWAPGSRSAQSSTAARAREGSKSAASAESMRRDAVLTVQGAWARFGRSFASAFEATVKAVMLSGARSRAWLSSAPFVKRSLSDAPSFQLPNQGNRLALVFDPTQADAPPFTFGVEIFPPRHRTPPHVHNTAHELFFIISGEGTAFCNGVRFPVGPGDTIVFPPGSEHGIDNSPGQRMYCLELMLPNEEFAEFVRAGTSLDGLEGSDMCVLALIGCR